MFEGFGGYAREVTTTDAAAQAWFDQGIQLLYGFNHDEAIRSFRKAAEADPRCAMAWWGIAYANGLHINNPEMSEASSEAAWDASQKAIAALDDETEVEAALVRSVAMRYAAEVPEDRSALDQAYAEAMEKTWYRFDQDPDVGALYAESLMNLQPWDLWTSGGEAKGRTLEIVDTLERVMEMRPDHPGANHFYIHAVEASPNPERAIAAADRLVDLVPGSGHLVHMPSHIYTRVGRYADAADANVRAIAADRAYFKVAPAPDFYNVYYLHNVHFLSYAAMMDGRKELALSASLDLEADIPEDFLRGYVQFADGFMLTRLHVMIRFGMWDDILAEPAPPAYRLLSRAQRHYARGVALSALGRTAEAREELGFFEAVAPEVPEDWSVGNNSAADVLALSRQMLLGELLYREGELDAAFAELRKGAALEDSLVYDEPPGWMQPVRHALGALLMAAGRAGEAEAVYRADLERNKENGWSLLGLENALAALGKDGEAAAIGRRREAAWKRADVAPLTSCYCEPGD